MQKVLEWTKIEERVAFSDVIVHGQIEALESYRASVYFLFDRPKHVSLEQFGDREMIFTKITINTSQVLLGAVSGDSVSFQVRGGRIGKMSTPFQAGYHFEAGKDIVVFLRKIDETNTVYPLAQDRNFQYRLATQAGLYYLEQSGSGGQLTPAFAGAFVNAPTHKAAFRRPLPLTELRKVIKARNAE